MGESPGAACVPGTRPPVSDTERGDDSGTRQLRPQLGCGLRGLPAWVLPGCCLCARFPAEMLEAVARVLLTVTQKRQRGT